MNFDAVDIEKFIQASMPLRFGDVSPYDFEAFVGELMRRDGYRVKETQYSGDFGADLLVETDRETTVVQIKRYAPQTLVGVNDLNQVIAAREYYKADAALVITTSGFTQASIALARSAHVMLWDWERFEQFISRVVFDGQDYYQYFSEDIAAQPDSGLFQIHFLRYQPDEATSSGDPAISIHIGLENLSGKNMYIHVDPPLIITRKNRQATAVEWKENYFHQGLHVSGATAEMACHFLSAQVPEVKTGDRMILRVFVEGQTDPVLIDQKVGDTGGKCYVVTYCYGRESVEYRAMISWRDEVWYPHSAGRAMAAWYYRHSPRLVAFVRERKMGWRGLNAVVRLIVYVMSRIALLHWNHRR